jgi:hypothetical protein
MKWVAVVAPVERRSPCTWRGARHTCRQGFQRVSFVGGLSVFVRETGRVSQRADQGNETDKSYKMGRFGASVSSERVVRTRPWGLAVPPVLPRQPGRRLLLLLPPLLPSSALLLLRRSSHLCPT